MHEERGAERERRILIVEDYDRHAELMALTVLQMEGNFVPVRAASGEEAIRLLGRQRFDVVLLDYALPDYNGLELLPKFLAFPNRPAVIMVTTASNIQIANQALKGGAAGIVLKNEAYLDVLPSVIHDALVRIDLKERVEELEEEIGRLESAAPAGGVSTGVAKHALSSLASIRFFLESLSNRQEKEQAPERVKEALQEVNRLIHRLRGLLDIQGGGQGGEGRHAARTAEEATATQRLPDSESETEDE